MLVNAPTKSPCKVDGAEAHQFVGFNTHQTQNKDKKKTKINKKLRDIETINIGINHFFFKAMQEQFLSVNLEKCFYPFSNWEGQK